MKRLLGSESEDFERRFKKGLKNYGLAMVKYGRNQKKNRLPACFNHTSDLISVTRDANKKDGKLNQM